MGFLEERDLCDVPCIPEFYTGKTIFITGGSGFMGQVLIEKLLFSCSDLDRIYLLVRRKKGAILEERLADIYSSEIFCRLKKERPGLYESKVMAIDGDLSEVDLGISESDRELLKNHVNIIFHAGATVRFDDELSQATKINLRSTFEIVKIAHEMKKLLALVYVSTAYSNVFVDNIEEKVYPPLADWRQTLDICENIDKDTINKFADKYMAGMPNTYVFTKHLSEQLVTEQKGKLPVIIIRPSIVSATNEEPIPGWLNNFKGPFAFAIGVGKGVIKDIQGVSDINQNFVPVDICIKHFIAAAWLRGSKSLELTDEVEVYNCCSKEEYFLKFGQCLKNATIFAKKYPYDYTVSPPHASITESNFIHLTKVFILQLIPAIIFDTLLWISGKKPFLLKIQRRVHQANVAGKIFLNRAWNFDNRNFNCLLHSIKSQDREQFDYDLTKVDPENCIKDMMIGSKQYLLKEKAENYPASRKRLFWMTLICSTAYYVIVGCLIWKIINTTYFNKIISITSDFFKSKLTKIDNSVKILQQFYRLR